MILKTEFLKMIDKARRIEILKNNEIFLRDILESFFLEYIQHYEINRLWKSIDCLELMTFI